MQHKKHQILEERGCHHHSCNSEAGDSCYESCTGYLDEECPADDTPFGLTSDVRLRSLCPWFYDITYDSNRYPVELVEARCCNTNCFSAPNLPSPTYCDRIKYTVPVLYKNGQTAPDGTCLYERKMETLAVGCACTAKPTGS